MAATRVLWVALDACDPQVARRLAAEGAMPHLAHLLETATVAPTTTDPGLFVGSVWATTATARDPVNHGFHCWGVYDSETYAYRETSPEEIVGEPFWQHLSDAGHQVAVIDVPHSDARRPIHGAHLSEWGCHDRHFGPQSYPPDLLAELVTELSAHPIGMIDAPSAQEPQFAPCDQIHRAGPSRTPGEEAALFDDLLRSVDNKASVSLRLLDRGDWDVFMTVFGESHCAGHQLWHLSDPTHPLHDPDLADRLGGDPIRQVYQRLDQGLGELLERTDETTTILVQLSHGMTAHHDGTHLLAPLLERLEDHVDGVGPRRWRTQAITVAHTLPAPMRRALLRTASPIVRRRVDSAPGEALHPPHQDRVPGPDRLWWSTPNNTVSGAVRLNVTGREGRGRIEPRRVPSGPRLAAQRIARRHQPRHRAPGGP